MGGRLRNIMDHVRARCILSNVRRVTRVVDFSWRNDDIHSVKFDVRIVQDASGERMVG